MDHFLKIRVRQKIYMCVYMYLVVVHCIIFNNGKISKLTTVLSQNKTKYGSTISKI